MCIHDIKNVHNEQFFMVGYPIEFNERYPKYLLDSPFTAGASVQNVGDVHTLAMMCPDEELFEKVVSIVSC